MSTKRSLNVWIKLPDETGILGVVPGQTMLLEYCRIKSVTHVTDHPSETEGIVCCAFL